MENNFNEVNMKNKNGASTKARRLTNMTLKNIMKSESKAAIDAFLRRFKSVQNFKPFEQTPKLLKYMQDLIKVITRQNK